MRAYKKFLILTPAFVSLTFFVSTDFVLSQERTAYEVGMSAAKKKGYDNPKCYADLYNTYASYDPSKGWVVKGRANQAWKLELWDKCKIQR